MASSLSLSSRRNLWDPYQVLDIYPNRPDSPCVGLAKTTGRRCRWSFNSEQYSDSQRATAVQLLDSMAAVHPSDVTTDELYSLARNTLCREFHQGQVDDVERRWRATIDAFVRGNGEMLAIDIEREREVAETDFREAREALEASQSRCSDLVEKNDRLEGEHAASSRDFALLERQLAELQTDAKSRDELNGKVEQLKRLTDERHATFENYADARSNEMRALKESKARLDGMMTTSSMEISSLKQKVQALDTRAERSEKEVKDLRQKLEASGREIADLQSKNEKIEQDQKIGQLDEKVQALDARAKRSEGAEIDLRQKLQTSNERYDALEKRSSGDSKRLGERLDALELKYKKSKDENIKQDRKIGQFVERMDKMRRDFDKVEGEISAYTSQLQEQDRNMKQLVGQMGVLNKALIEREVSRTCKGRTLEEIADI